MAKRIYITSPTADLGDFYRCKRCLDDAGIPFNRIDQAKLSGPIVVYIKEQFLSAALNALRSAGIAAAASVSLGERLRQYLRRPQGR